MTEVYKYGIDFQRLLMAISLRDPKFILDYQDIIDPKYFDDSATSTIMRLLLDHIATWKLVPTKETFHLILTEYLNKHNFDQSIRKEHLDKFYECYELSLVDAEFIKDRAIRFGRHQALRKCVLDQISILTEQDESQYEGIRQRIEKALNVGGQKDPGYDLTSNLERMSDLVRQSGTYDMTKRIRTLIPKLDHYIMGGLGRGELGKVEGPPGKGKSSVLINFGEAACRQGKTVVHYTLELKEVDVLIKYAANMSSATIDSIVDGDPNYVTKIKDRLDLYSAGKVIVKFFPNLSIGVSGLRSHLTALRSQGIKPDLIIVDYADLLAKPKDQKFSSDYDAMGYIYQELIWMGCDFDAAVWTGSQVNREGYSAETIMMEHTSDSAKKNHHGDISISLNQTLEQYRQGVMRLFLQKVRRGVMNMDVMCNLDLSRCKLTETEWS